MKQMECSDTHEDCLATGTACVSDAALCRQECGASMAALKTPQLSYTHIVAVQSHAVVSFMMLTELTEISG